LHVGDPGAIVSAVAQDYSWQDARGISSFRLPTPDNFGWWVGVAILMALLLHVALFFVLGHLRIQMVFEEALGIQTAPVNVEQVEVRPQEYEEVAPIEEIEEPPEDASTLLEEIDMLEMMPEDTEIDIRPDVLEPQIAIELESPAMSGDIEGTLPEPVVAPAIEVETEELGQLERSFATAAEGQVIVDPGAAVSDTIDPDAFTEDLLKKGAEGAADKGALKDFTSLEDMLGMEGNALLDKTAMIGSDLLFEYNSDVLRQSAKLSLMKVAMLIDRNPGLYCWIEGHTDLFGGDGFNLDLSRRRSSAVKSYLVSSLRMPSDRMVVRGFGKTMPVVPEGTVEEQALNRRVEIKMRRERGSDEPVMVKPKRAIPVLPEVLPKPKPPEAGERPKPMPVREPPKALPVGDPTRFDPVEEEPLRAIPRAEPVETSPPPRAISVE
jgi:OOP family OmpA-OmpF porin